MLATKKFSSCLWAVFVGFCVGNHLTKLAFKCPALLVAGFSACGWVFKWPVLRVSLAMSLSALVTVFS